MARPAGNNPAKSQITKIKMANKRINNTHRIVFANIIFKPLRKQSDLAAVFAFDKTRHLKIPKINITGFYHRSRFDTAWVKSRLFCVMPIMSAIGGEADIKITSNSAAADFFCGSTLLIGGG